MKNIAIIGSTGSIGTQALEVAAERGYKICALSAGSNIGVLELQARRWKPQLVAVFDEKAGAILRQRLADTSICVLTGQEGVCKAAAISCADIVLNATVGIAGLAPSLSAINGGKTLALANKESLVCAGSIVCALAKEKNVAIIPVDSEHSAIFQCLKAGEQNEVERVIITCSGGPFFGKNKQEIYNKTAMDALKHPSWSMGAKITVDSATLMNKGFEVIEAAHLFELLPNQIDVVVHPESIIHSMVEFRDGSVIAQMSPPDMRLPIQYALDFPKRVTSQRRRLCLPEIGKITFSEPDIDTFPSLELCRKALACGGNMAALINGANEAAVGLFLQNAIPFGRIYELVAGAVDEIEFIKKPTLEQIYESDLRARSYVSQKTI